MLVQKEAPAVVHETVRTPGSAESLASAACTKSGSVRWSCTSNRQGFTRAPTQRQGIFKQVTQRLGGNYRKTLIRSEQAELLISFKKPV